MKARQAPRQSVRASSISAADYLQKLPVTGSAINRLNNSSGNLGFPPDGAGIGAGASEIDLRNLGSKRTLVLVDGRRWIRGSSASGVAGAVDINTIPNNAVKSIEISLDGAFNAQNISIALGPVDTCNAVPGCVPFAWAAGYEHRKEDGSFTPDSVVSSGFTAGVPAQPTDGGFDVDEFYAEFIVPVWRGDGQRKLDISASARYSNYNLFDSDTVWAAGANWSPIDSLTIRANYAQGFRAPNIGELFNTGSRFDASINDPCSNAQPDVQANCILLGVPPGYQQANPQISVTTGGNVGLTPETSDTFTAGFTWDVQSADNWSGVDGLLFDYTETVPGPVELHAGC